MCICSGKAGAFTLTGHLLCSSVSFLIKALDGAGRRCDMSRAFKRLTFEDRLEIEQMLSVDMRVSTIAESLGFSRQSITREIIRSRIDEGRARIYGKYWNGCVYQRTCRVTRACNFDSECAKRCASCRIVNCTKTCTEFKANSCPRLARSPWCCNGCPSYKACAYTRLRYSAKAAQARAEELLVSSRIGPDITEDELALIAHIAAPLLKRGQSPAQIWLAYKDSMPCSERSFYRHVANGNIPGVVALNLPSALRCKPRSKEVSTKTNISEDALVGRTYADFLLLGDGERSSACEMDCVCGIITDKAALLTVYLRPWKFQFIDLLGTKTSRLVAAHIDEIASFIEPRFPSYILVDRGTEFAWAEGIETSGITGEKRTSLYYCDARHPEQRGASENNHRLIRRIIPKGASLEGLTGVDVATLTSHINSMPRKSHGGKSPMHLARRHLPISFFKEYGLELIPSDEIVLKPKLLGL